MSKFSGLERAVAVAEGVSPEVGYDVLLTAVKRFLRSSERSILNNVCPDCGCSGAHFCPGKKLRPLSNGLENFIKDSYAIEEYKSRGKILGD